MPKLNPIVRVFLSAVLSVAGLGQSAVALPLIWVDAGHGGSDPGAIGCGAQEADVTLAVSLKLKALIDSDGDLENARMTRSTDVFVSLAARSANANSAGATRFVSIHNNSCCGASGIETFHYNASPSGDSVNQAQEIQGAMTDTWPALPDRGVKSANFSVLRNTDMPATLSELGFIDNCANDSALLQSPAGQQAAAEAHYQAIRRSLGLGEGVVTPPDTGTLRGTVFEDQGVGTADMSIRLPNARIVVRNSSGATQETTPGGADGVWAFALNSGSWTVTATESGYDPTVQTCVVTGGQTTWCSIGVFPTVVVPPDPDPEPDTTDTDTGTPADTGSATDTGTADDTGTATDTGAPTDTGVATDTGNPQDTGDGSGLPTLGTPGRKSELNRIDAE
ncbi:MAG: N-acetylmuramoyl-L-alanine amidase, partial [Myxococcota bacterium]